MFHPGSALGVPPSELCSSHAAVRRSWRPYPHVVGRSFSPAASSSRSVGLRPASVQSQHTDVQKRPAFRVLLRMRVRHFERWLRSFEMRSSLGFAPLQGLSSPEWHGLHRPSPLGVTFKLHAAFEPPSGSCLPARLACLSKEKATPHGVCGLDHHARSG